MCYKCLVIFLLFTACAEGNHESYADARHPRVNVILMQGQDSVTPNMFLDTVWPEVEYRFRQDVRLKIKLKSISVMQVPRESWFTTMLNFHSTQTRRLHFCKDYVAQFKHKKNEAYLCVLPPMRDDAGLRYVAGMAFGSEYGRKKPVAIAQCEPTSNNPNIGRLYACAVISAHELAHLFGAMHTMTEPNLMDTGAGAYWDRLRYRLRFLPITKVQIRAYIRRLRRRARK